MYEFLSELSPDAFYRIYCVMAAIGALGLVISGGWKKWPIVMGIPAFVVLMCLLIVRIGQLADYLGTYLITTSFEAFVLWLPIVAANIWYTRYVKPEVITRFYEMCFLWLMCPFLIRFFSSELWILIHKNGWLR